MSSNNVYFDFPPIMSDGRNYATWQPGAAINKAIREKEGIMNNSQYRSYLITNADKIMKANKLEAYSQSSPSSSLFGSKKNIRAKQFGKETSDLKDIYLSRRQLEKRQVTPVMTQEQLLSFQR